MGRSRLKPEQIIDMLREAEIKLAGGKTTDEGWPSSAFSNHDARRVASRWGTDIDLDQRVRLISLLQFSLRGNRFLYPGEELCLSQAHVPYEKLQYPEAFTDWPYTLGHDGDQQALCIFNLGDTPTEWVPDVAESFDIVASVGFDCKNPPAQLARREGYIGLGRDG